MKANISKIVVGTFGLLGTILAEGTLIKILSSLKTLTIQNYLGAIVITLLCACSAVSCLYLIWQGRAK